MSKFRHLKKGVKPCLFKVAWAHTATNGVKSNASLAKVLSRVPFRSSLHCCSSSKLCSFHRRLCALLHLRCHSSGFVTACGAFRASGPDVPGTEVRGETGSPLLRARLVVFCRAEVENETSPAEHNRIHNWTAATDFTLRSAISVI